MRNVPKKTVWVYFAHLSEFLLAIISTVSRYKISMCLINFVEFVNKIKFFVNLVPLFLNYDRIIMLEILAVFESVGFFDLIFTGKGGLTSFREESRFWSHSQRHLQGLDRLAVS